MADQPDSLLVQAVELLTLMLVDSELPDQPEQSASMLLTINGDVIRVSLKIEDLGSPDEG